MSIFPPRYLFNAATADLATRWPSAMALARYSFEPDLTSPAATPAARRFGRLRRQRYAQWRPVQANPAGIPQRETGRRKQTPHSSEWAFRWPSFSTVTASRPLLPSRPTMWPGRAVTPSGTSPPRCPEHGDLAGDADQHLGLIGSPSGGAGDDDRLGRHRAGRRSSRSVKGRDLHTRPHRGRRACPCSCRSQRSASGRCGARRRSVSTSKGPLPEIEDDFAEADLHTGDDGIVGEAGGHRRAVEHLFEIVEMAEIDDFAARRELVEAERLQARAGNFSGGGESGRPAPMTITS